MRAKKSLGQNFLTSKGIAADIVRTADIAPGDTILEVGPGKGFLTEALIDAGARACPAGTSGEVRMIAVEKDDRLQGFLREKFAGAIEGKTLAIIHDDILRTDIKTLVHGKPYKVVANIPYYITGELVRFFLENTHQPERMVLMVQKEVAERIVARGGKGSILSTSVAAYGTPRYVKTVPARSFRPRPNVDSAILSIDNISNELFADMDRDMFFALVKSGFAHKRKLLLSNIAKLYGKETIKEAFAACALPEKVRAEELALSDWVCIARTIKGHFTSES